MKKPLQLALYGMDERSIKTMTMYLKGPCKGKAVVVEAQEAEASLLDADHVKARVLLEQCQQNNPHQPIILLSLETVSIANTIFVKKPVQTVDLIKALEQVYLQLNGKRKPKTFVSAENMVKPLPKTPSVTVTEQEVITVNEITPPEKKHIDNTEIRKIAKHRTAMDLTEKSYSSYIGFVEGINFSDPQQVILASYNPKDYYQGYVQSACKVAKDKSKTLTLNSGWKPLILFPDTEEVWLDADEKQLRAFAGLSVRNNPLQDISLQSTDLKKIDVKSKMDNYQDIECFLWKLAAWTSKGRYPHSIDILKPVYITRWPNFTRLLITPHAMRIAALLIIQPRSALNVAKALNIKAEYVFVFLSSAHATGILGQTKRQADMLVEQNNEIKASKSKGLLSRILGRLRG